MEEGGEEQSWQNHPVSPACQSCRDVRPVRQWRVSQEFVRTRPAVVDGVLVLGWPADWDCQCMTSGRHSTLHLGRPPRPAAQHCQHSGTIATFCNEVWIAWNNRVGTTGAVSFNDLFSVIVYWPDRD